MRWGNWVLDTREGCPYGRYEGFAVLLGTILHFVYGWTNKSVFVAPFSAVNESTWEHMKILYFPLVIYAFIESRYFGRAENFWYVKLVGILAGLLLIPMLFYGLRGAFGSTPDFVNIAIFFIVAAAVFVLETHLFKNGALEFKYPIIPIAAIVIVAVLFVVFTFITPKLPLFSDPITKTYGLPHGL